MHFWWLSSHKDNLYCLCSIKVFKSFCFIRDVFHDGVAWCVMHDADSFSRCSIFSMGFSTVLSWALLWSLPICFDVTGYLLWLCDYIMQVRLFILCVCLCVWVSSPLWSTSLYWNLWCSFDPFYTLLLICLGYIVSVGLTMQISPFLNGNVFTRLLFLQLLVDKIGCINHAWFLWEPLCLADPWLIAQLSLLFLSYVFVIEVCHLIMSLQQCCHGNFCVDHWSDLILVGW